VVKKIKRMIWLARHKFLVSGLVVVTVIPFFIRNDYWIHVLILSSIWAIVACGYDLLAGYTGQVSLCPAAFFGVGAYSSALAALKLSMSPWLGLIIGATAAAMFGLLIGFPCLRLTGPYLAMVTLGFSEILRLALIYGGELTMGPWGLSRIPIFPGIPYSKITYYYLTLSILLLSIIILRAIVNSRFGIAFRAIRENTIASEAVGIDTTKYKLLAFTLSAFFSGLAGSIYAHYMLAISPDLLLLSVSANVIMFTIVGGLGTIVGPVFATFLLTVISESLRSTGFPILRLILFGSILVIFVMFLPNGIASLFRRSASKR
jgi:branched-chain amino acid transport system permease protein